MRKIFVLLVALGLVGAAASCKTLNVGGPGPVRFVINSVDLSTTTPTAGDDVTATIHFSGQSGPFTFTATFSDCVTPTTQTVTVPAGATSASLTFTTTAFTVADDANGKDCSVSVSGHDANNTPGGPVTANFHVAPIPNLPPVITNLTFNPATCTVTATVTDTEGDLVTITPSNVPASLVAPAANTVTGGNGTSDFVFAATDILSGGTGTVTFTPSDPTGGTGLPQTVDVNCPAIALLPDTLYAVPLSTTTTVGTPVTIEVLTGDPANPFQYMTGVRVVTDSASGFDYDGGSFNVGAPGGAADDVDGFWTNMSGISNGDFLLAPDSFYSPVDAGGGLTGLDFNVTPLGGSDVATGSGALFNFGATFTTPGTYTLGFQQTNVVNRTYYQDANQAPDYFWGDITNSHAGIPNSITVQ